MIRDTFRVSRNGLPIISDREIDRMAEHIVADYDPILLDIPQPVPIEMILEAYFDLILDYQYLSHNGFLMGMTVFMDNTVVPIYDPKTDKAVDYPADRGTVLIDVRLTDMDAVFRRRITMAHEIGHWFFHRLYFSRKVGGGATAARVIDGRDNIESWGPKRLVDDEDWLEHQANYFSGAILMPESAFRKAAESDYVRKYVWLMSARSCEESRNEHAARCLANIFRVSMQAVLIRMQSLGITMGEGMTGQEFEAFRQKALAERKKGGRKRRTKSEAAPT